MSQSDFNKIKDLTVSKAKQYYPNINIHAAVSSTRTKCNSSKSNNDWNVNTEDSINLCGTAEQGNIECLYTCCGSQPVYCHDNCFWEVWDYEGCMDTCMADRGCTEFVLEN